MRLILSGLFALIILAISATVMANAVLEREAQNETSANKLGTQFVWPADPLAADPEIALRVLVEAATATRSNVLRTTVNIAGQKRIRHYIFMGSDRTALFDEFTLAAGRWLSPAESRAGLMTVSSVRAGERNNVGVPAVFGDRYELTFAPLRQAFDSLPSSGRYVVESPDQVATDRFLALVAQGLIEAGVTVTVADLASHTTWVPSETSGNLEVLAYILAALATLIIAVILLREGKRIGVLRLVGHPAVRIWYRVVGQLLIASLCIGLVACAVVSLAVPGVDALFMRVLAVTFSQVAVVAFTATMGVGLIIINRVQISDLIKGSLQ